MIKRIIFCLFLGIFSFSPIFSQHNSQISSHLDFVTTNELQNNSPGGSVLVSKKGKILLHKDFGKSNFELDVDVNAKSVFRIASLSKQFTAVAILKLYEEGKIDIEAPIGTYLQGYPKHLDNVKVSHLLSHTSGIKDYLNLPNFDSDARRIDLTPKELANLFKNEPLDFKPGSQYDYSSSGYVLLGLIIESVTGQKYSEYMQNEIFKPIGLKNTYCDDTSQLIENRVSGYIKDSEDYKNAEYLSMTLPYAAGSLMSTTNDMNLWNEALEDGKVIKKQTLLKCQTPFILDNGQNGLQGYGWEIGNVKGKKALKHSGGINGFTTFSLSVPEEQIYIVILLNKQGFQNLNSVATRMAAVAMGNPFQLSEKNISDASKAKLNGIYQDELGNLKTLRIENGAITFFSSGGQKEILFAKGKNNFFTYKGSKTYEFKLGKTNLLIENDTYRITQWTKTENTIQSLAYLKFDEDYLSQFSGTYELNGDLQFIISVKENHLIGQIRNERKRLFPISKTQFVAEDIDATLNFSLNDDGKVTGFELKQGNTMSALKVN